MVEDTLEEINRIEIASEDLDHLAGIMENFPGLEKLRKNTTSLHLSLKEEYIAKDVNAFCFEQGVVLRRLITHTNSLEQEFLKILKEHD